MISRHFLSLEMANKIADTVVETAKSHKFAPITVVILDSFSNVIVQKRMDFCPPVGFPQFALAKANTCIITKTSSRSFRDKYCSFPAGDIPDPKKYGQMIIMSQLAEGGGMANFPGGVLLKLRETGEIIGAIGVSGASSDEDELCALTGAKLYEEIITTDPQS